MRSGVGFTGVRDEVWYRVLSPMTLLFAVNTGERERKWVGEEKDRQVGG